MNPSARLSEIDRNLLTSATTREAGLRTEAQRLGIQTSFIDSSGQIQTASDESLQRLIGLLRNETEPERIAEPVTVCWQKRRNKLAVHSGPREILLRLEDGVERKLRPADLQNLPELPIGYHKLILRDQNREESTLLISAPLKLYSRPVRDWGVFLPMYAAHSQESWGAGNLSDWTRLSTWIAAQGGRVAGTLPVLAGFLDYPKCDPSPYSPASRLFWNEFYIDIAAIPEFNDSVTARQLVARSNRKLRRFRESDYIDYPAEWEFRRKVLMILANEFRNSPRFKELRAYVRARPEAEDYARFRAACEQFKTSWHNWPPKVKHPPELVNFYLYIQWIAQQQIERTLATCRASGVKFYLDLPLGVNPDGFDAWRYQTFFVQAMNAGAPPDAFFTKGQDWGFAPLHPRRIREEHYRYVIDYLRFQMRHTGLLRIDHVMGLHRLWWVPHGRPASEGAYVRYKADELYAILSVESHRHQTMLVGENLGTVPPEVNRSMDRHGVRRMYVLQYEQPVKGPPRTPAKAEVASVNTHDMPAFAAHWNGADILDRYDLGLIPKKDLPREKKRRAEMQRNLVSQLRKLKLLKNPKPKAKDVLAAVLKFLARSPAEIVLVTLEDLWLEERSQNVPGTSIERPNWRRKTARSLEEIEGDRPLAELLRELSRLRNER